MRKTNSELTDCRRFADFEVNTIMLSLPISLIPEKHRNSENKNHLTS